MRAKTKAFFGQKFYILSSSSHPVFSSYKSNLKEKMYIYFLFNHKKSQKI